MSNVKEQIRRRKLEQGVEECKREISNAVNGIPINPNTPEPRELNIKFRDSCRWLGSKDGWRRNSACAYFQSLAFIWMFIGIVLFCVGAMIGI